MKDRFDELKNKTISVKSALEIAHKYGKNITMATLIKWLDENNKECRLYHQPGGPSGKIYVFEESYLKFITGQA